MKREILEYKEENEQEKFLKVIEKFCLFDDDFMRKCFEESPECTELVLQIIMNKPDLQVTDMHHQYEIKNLQGHSIEMDVFAIDEEGRKYNIEVQRRNSGAKPKRARYYSSLIDANSLKKAEDFERLLESYVIFITENDVLGDGLPLYDVDRYMGQNRKRFVDAEHIIYVNGRCIDDTPLGRLMHDFSCTRADDMYYKVLSDKVRYFKETQKGREKMCEIMEKIYADGEKRGRREGFRKGERKGEQKGFHKANKSVAQRLLAEGSFSLEKISELCQLTLAEVQKLQSKP